MSPLRFTTTQQFPVGLDDLWKACSNARYVEQKYRALGSSSVRLVGFEVEPPRIDVRLERTVAVPLGRLASWLPVPLPATFKLCHHTRWWRIAPDRAVVQVEIAARGVPITAHACGDLHQVARESTRMRLDWQVRAGSAWVTAGIQRLFAREVRRGLEQDHAFTIDFLGERPRPARQQQSSAG